MEERPSFGELGPLGLPKLYGESREYLGSYYEHIFFQRFFVGSFLLVDGGEGERKDGSNKLNLVDG